MSLEISCNHYDPDGIGVCMHCERSREDWDRRHPEGQYTIVCFCLKSNPISGLSQVTCVQCQKVWTHLGKGDWKSGSLRTGSCVEVGNKELPLLSAVAGQLVTDPFLPKAKEGQIDPAKQSGIPLYGKLELIGPWRPSQEKLNLHDSFSPVVQKDITKVVRIAEVSSKEEVLRTALQNLVEAAHEFRVGLKDREESCKLKAALVYARIVLEEVL